MVSVRLEAKPAFLVAGRKVWISGQDNEQFAAFWRRSHEDGLVDTLKGIARKGPGSQTRSDVIGVSRVENDPDNRAFDFYIAAEIGERECPEELERFTIPAATWAIFSHENNLIAAEMHAFTQWLPASPYRHAMAPEMEVYPVVGENEVEFWLPVIPAV